MFGDGLQIIAVSPTNSRPEYYVVRIDSSWSLDNGDNSHLLYDHLNEIYDVIEDEYGYIRCDCDEEDCDDNNCENCSYCEECRKWPTSDFSMGAEWFLIDKVIANNKTIANQVSI